MRQRWYAVDDMDFEEYRRRGGTETRAQFFNRELAPCCQSCATKQTDAAPEPLSRRLERLTGSQQSPGSLSDRLRHLLQ